MPTLSQGVNTNTAGSRLSCLVPSPATQTAVLQELEWSTPASVLSSSWDLVLAADLVYQAANLPTLVPLLAELLQVCPKVVMVHRSRQDELDEQMVERLAQAGITVQRLPLVKCSVQLQTAASLQLLLLSLQTDQSPETAAPACGPKPPV